MSKKKNSNWVIFVRLILNGDMRFIPKLKKRCKSSVNIWVNISIRYNIVFALIVLVWLCALHIENWKDSILKDLFQNTAFIWKFTQYTFVIVGILFQYNYVQHTEW